MLAIAGGKWYNGFELVSLGTMSSTCPVPQSRDVDAISVNKKVKGVFEQNDGLTIDRTVHIYGA